MVGDGRAHRWVYRTKSDMDHDPGKSEGEVGGGMTRRYQFSLRALLAGILTLALFIPITQTLVNAVYDARERARAADCSNKFRVWNHACYGEDSCPICQERQRLNRLAAVQQGVAAEQVTVSGLNHLDLVD